MAADSRYQEQLPVFASLHALVHLYQCTCSGGQTAGMFIWSANLEVDINMSLTMIEKINVWMALVRQDIWSMLLDIDIMH